MFAVIAGIILVLWLLGFSVFHFAGSAIHLLLIVAAILFIYHFVRGTKSV